MRFPGFGLLLNYIAVALVIALVLATPAWIERLLRKRAVKEQDGKKAGKRRPGFLQVVTGPVAIVAGYLPVFMYLQYLALTLTP